MMRRAPVALLISCLLAACSKSEKAMHPLPDVRAVRPNLAFTCTHEAEHLPPLDPEADKLFLYGRYLRNNEGKKDFSDIARYYRIAAAYDHYKANQSLQSLISQGLANSPDGPTEAVDLAIQLIKQGVPGGYYDIGHYLETGYGLKPDGEASLRYLRKAADLGNPEAQAYVAEQLAPHDRAPDIARQMRQCAADQGYGDAANTLGVFLQDRSDYAAAIKAFQQGVSAGDSLSASVLRDGFKGPPSSNQLDYLDLPNDPERSRRYDLIGKFLDANDGRRPKVPDIDKIVPLPPAKLPPWDGTFQWKKEQDAATPPAKPSDELITGMARARHLDPSTGLPVPGTANKTSPAE
ncbi:SEL1-like repeat protein [Burkholderia sp. JKS000303]|uniref:SEL1-like repeat protein n=1 Tax=Burkholderia sp. JKS000303 TaxID=1938747 RepID=UPI000C011533|nr:sel1 repeat family protein [Burkholderia sp. JKS000303]PFH19414.1 hypothetical protein BX604_6015 [Burkholderia sp. JKS000303]